MRQNIGWTYSLGAGIQSLNEYYVDLPGSITITTDGWL